MELMRREPQIREKGKLNVSDSAFVLSTDYAAFCTLIGMVKASSKSIALVAKSSCLDFANCDTYSFHHRHDALTDYAKCFQLCVRFSSIQIQLTYGLRKFFSSLDNCCYGHNATLENQQSVWL